MTRERVSDVGLHLSMQQLQLSGAARLHANNSRASYRSAWEIDIVGPK